MKKILFISGIVLMAGFAAFAQKQNNIQQKDRSTQQQLKRNVTPNQIAEKRTQRLDKDVQLSPEQKIQVKEVYLKQAELQKERVAIRKESRNEVENILTAEQQAKYDQLKKARMEEMKDRRIERKETKMPQGK